MALVAIKYTQLIFQRTIKRMYSSFASGLSIDARIYLSRSYITEYRRSRLQLGLSRIPNTVYTRSFDEYRERGAVFLLLLFSFFLVSVSRERTQRNCEKLTKCELWIQDSGARKHVDTFYFAEQTFFRLLPSFLPCLPPLFVAPAEVACELETEHSQRVYLPDQLIIPSSRRTLGNMHVFVVY